MRKTPILLLVVAIIVLITFAISSSGFGFFRSEKVEPIYSPVEYCEKLLGPADRVEDYNGSVAGAILQADGLYYNLIICYGDMSVYWNCSMKTAFTTCVKVIEYGGIECSWVEDEAGEEHGSWFPEGITPPSSKFSSWMKSKEAYIMFLSTISDKFAL